MFYSPDPTLVVNVAEDSGSGRSGGRNNNLIEACIWDELQETKWTRWLAPCVDSAQASDINQLNDAGIAIEGIVKETGTNKENWDEWRARLMEEQGRIQPGTGNPKIFISSKLVDLDADGNEFNFFVKEAENPRWEETKTNLGIEQKPTWGSSRIHAIDALSYLLAKVHKPISTAPMPPPTTNLVKPFPGQMW